MLCLTDHTGSSQAASSFEIATRADSDSQAAEQK